MGNTCGRAQRSRKKLEILKREHKKLEILKRVHEFPIPLRETIQASKAENPKLFLSTLEKGLENLLYGGFWEVGLDYNRDTHQEVETAIRFFPNIIAGWKRPTHPPIYAQLSNIKSIPFIPLFARLGLEYDNFEEEHRGGLLYERPAWGLYPNSWNALRILVNNSFQEWYDEEDHYLVDKHSAAVIQALGDSGFFRMRDIRLHDLARQLCYNHSFPEHRFRCLVDYDPDIFYRLFESYTPENICYPKVSGSIYNIWPHQSAFRTIFEIGFFYFPTQLGFVFHVDNNSTPFSRACHEYGTETVTKFIGDILSNDEETIDTTEALIQFATNPSVHLDGVYFLLRRDPSRCCQAPAKACR